MPHVAVTDGVQGGAEGVGARAGEAKGEDLHGVCGGAGAGRRGGEGVEGLDKAFCHGGGCGGYEDSREVLQG